MVTSSRTLENVFLQKNVPAVITDFYAETEKLLPQPGFIKFENLEQRKEKPR